MAAALALAALAGLSLQGCGNAPAPAPSICVSKHDASKCTEGLNPNSKPADDDCCALPYQGGCASGYKYLGYGSIEDEKVCGQPVQDPVTGQDMQKYETCCVPLEDYVTDFCPDGAVATRCTEDDGSNTFNTDDDCTAVERMGGCMSGYDFTRGRQSGDLTLYGEFIGQTLGPEYATCCVAQTR